MAEPNLDDNSTGALRVNTETPAGQRVAQRQERLQPGQTAALDPNFTPGPGFIPFDVVEGRAPIDEVMAVMADQLRFMSEPEIEKRETEFRRTFAIDMAAKGTLAYKLAGTFGRQLKKLGRRPSAIGFVSGAVLGDIAGESVLQAIEISAGVRDEFSFKDTAFSASVTAITGTGGTLLTKMAGRIGGITPRAIKEAAFSNFFRQLRLILPRRVSAQFARSAEFTSATKLQETVGRIFRPSNFLGEGVSNADALLPSAMRNVELLRKADEAKVFVDIKPVLDKARSLAKRVTSQRSMRGVLSELTEFADDLESKMFLKHGDTRTPATWCCETSKPGA